jgi:hypothetical protein
MTALVGMKQRRRVVRKKQRRRLGKEREGVGDLLRFLLCGWEEIRQRWGVGDISLRFSKLYSIIFAPHTYNFVSEVSVRMKL